MRPGTEHRFLKHIGEMERELTKKRDIEVNNNKNVTEKQQDELEK